MDASISLRKSFTSGFLSLPGGFAQAAVTAPWRGVLSIKRGRVGSTVQGIPTKINLQPCSPPLPKFPLKSSKASWAKNISSFINTQCKVRTITLGRHRGKIQAIPAYTEGKAHPSVLLRFVGCTSMDPAQCPAPSLYPLVNLLLSHPEVYPKNLPYPAAWNGQGPHWNLPSLNHDGLGTVLLWFFLHGKPGQLCSYISGKNTSLLPPVSSLSSTPLWLLTFEWRHLWGTSGSGMMPVTKTWQTQPENQNWGNFQLLLSRTDMSMLAQHSSGHSWWLI